MLSAGIALGYSAVQVLVSDTDIPSEDPMFIVFSTLMSNVELTPIIGMPAVTCRLATNTH